MNSIMETVCAVCNDIRLRTTQGMSFQKLMNAIRREFKLRGLELKLSSVRDKTLLQEVFYANGYYDPEDDKDQECPFEVIITHNFPKDHVWYPEHATLLLIQIFDTVVHELKHQRQYRKRKYKTFVERDDSHEEYLADPDEIDAYSISIAIELCRSLGRIRALRYLNNIEKISRFKLHGQFVSPSLSMYSVHKPLLKRLSKKVYVRLKKIDTDFIFM